MESLVRSVSMKDGVIWSVTNLGLLMAVCGRRFVGEQRFSSLKDANDALDFMRCGGVIETQDIHLRTTYSSIGVPFTPSKIDGVTMRFVLGDDLLYLVRSE